MSVLVAGATGALGTEIVRVLRAHDLAVVALVRTTSAPEKVADLERAGATIVRGDLKDPETLPRACHNVDAVVSTVSMALTAQPGDSFAATDGAGTKNLIDASRAAGVGHFVFVSFDTSVVPDCPLTKAKKEAEDHLIQSGLTYTILHPSHFMESWLGPRLFADPLAGTVSIYGAGNNRIRYVALSNVAELAVQCLTSSVARNAIIPFGGLETLTQREALGIFEKVYGRPFTVSARPEQALEAQWRAAEDPFERTYSALMLSTARRDDSDMRPPYESFPMEMVNVSDFVRAAAHK